MGENTKTIPEWKLREMEKADEILAEIIETKAFKESIQESIAEGEDETKRTMFENALYSFFDDTDAIEQSPILVKTLIEDIKGSLEAEIPGTWRDVKRSIATRGELGISIDLEDVTDDEFKPVKEALKRKTDEWIEETITDLI